MRKLTDEERQELQILNSGVAKYLQNAIAVQISVLTPKALAVRISENERLPLLGGIDQLSHLLSTITERHTSLKNRMEEEKNGRRNEN